MILHLFTLFRKQISLYLYKYYNKIMQYKPFEAPPLGKALITSELSLKYEYTTDV